MPKKIPPTHPGELLKMDYLEPLGMTPNALANALGVTAARINEIVLGRRGITPDTALRLAKYFGTSPDIWVQLQAQYDLDVAEDRTDLQKSLEAIQPRGGRETFAEEILGTKVDSWL